MDYIWSPWRMEYISRSDHHSDRCIFCAALEDNNDPVSLIVHRASFGFVILNRYPYTNGHLMIVPYAHQPSFDTLEKEARAELMELMAQAVQVLGRLYNPAGFNVGANIGTAAGAGVTGHVHFHVLPRWVGDTNFMTTLASTRVLPETMEDTYSKVRRAWGGS
jgi:ATP adenylyltransferase